MYIPVLSRTGTCVPRSTTHRANAGVGCSVGGVKQATRSALQKSSFAPSYSHDSTPRLTPHLRYGRSAGGCWHGRFRGASRIVWRSQSSRAHCCPHALSCLSSVAELAASSPVGSIGSPNCEKVLKTHIVATHISAFVYCGRPPNYPAAELLS